LEAVTATSVPLFLDSNANPTDLAIAGTLRPVAPRGKPDGYLYDPRDVSNAALETELNPGSLIEQRLVLANRGKHLVYETAPYGEDTEVSGFFRLSAWISIDQPDTDFQAVVYEVARDGSSIKLSQDLVRARYRESSRTPRLIETKEPLRYDFNQFHFVSRLIKKGNSLRLILGPNNSIYTEKNYNSGGTVASETVKDARPVNVVVHHSQEYPSIFYVPLGRPDRGRDGALPEH
jgi:putative CocE/NonD family hydrolase